MFHFTNENMHHAYLVKGDRTLAEDLSRHLNTLGLPTFGSPDFYLQEAEVFSIDDARALKLFQMERGVETGKKVIVIVTSYFSHPAQHALLKIFEEPAPGVHFFIITKEVSVLLPTLLSRLIVLVPESASSSPETKKASSFLTATLPERMKVVEKILNTFSKEETSIPLKEYTASFLNAIEEEAGKSPEKYNVELIWKTRDYLHDSGSSVKMLLEMLALTLER